MSVDKGMARLAALRAKLEAPRPEKVSRKEKRAMRDRNALKAYPGNWKAVVGFEGFYEVRDDGVLRRVAPGIGTRVGKLVRGYINDNGYIRVDLCRDTVKSVVYIHAIVAEAFIGSRPEGYTVNHIDGNKMNNAASNLEYLRREDNISHGHRIGLYDSKKTKRVQGACNEKSNPRRNACLQAVR